MNCHHRIAKQGLFSVLDLFRCDKDRSFLYIIVFFVRFSLQVK